MTTATNGNPAASVQKKRALEALERRFAVAKELQEQNKSNKKRSHFKEEERVEGNKGEAEEVSLDPPETDVPFKKGNFTFSGGSPWGGPAGLSDPQAQVPAYFELSQNIHETLFKPGGKLSGKGVSAVNKIVHDLLQNGDSGKKYMQGSRSMKINNWFLLDNFVPGPGTSTDARVKALQRHSKRSKMHMSMKQHRKCGSFDLPKEFHRFDLFKPMHATWKDYIGKLLKNTGRNQIMHRLLTADLHGAILLVVECKATTFTGVNGIMIRETAETFGIITEEDKFRVVPKKDSVFIFQADSWKITLYGDQLSQRVISS